MLVSAPIQNGTQQWQLRLNPQKTQQRFRVICSNNKKLVDIVVELLPFSLLFAVRILRRCFWTEIGHLAHCAAATVRQCTCYGSSFLCFLEHPMLSSWARRPPVEATLWPKLPNFGQKLWFCFNLRDLAFVTPILTMGFLKL